jgi:hypothetical protein
MSGLNAVCLEDMSHSQVGAEAHAVTRSDAGFRILGTWSTDEKDLEIGNVCSPVLLMRDFSSCHV